jgi:hypothetical protein
MSMHDITVLVGIIAAFGVFATAVAWAQIQSGGSHR